MLTHRRGMRPLALAMVSAAIAAAPAAAHARPAIDPPVNHDAATSITDTEPSAAPIVREIRSDGDTTLALVLSGSALVIAAAAAGLGAHDHRRAGRAA